MGHAFAVGHVYVERVMMYNFWKSSGNSESDMERIVYLLGAGSTRGEMAHAGIESDITMKGIGENVLRLSEKKAGQYSKLHRDFGLPENQDIEIMMSLLEGFTEAEASEFKEVCNEVRQLFRSYLITEICEKKVRPRIFGSLLHLHKSYGEKMGRSGEELTGVLTVNYDSLADEAFMLVHKGINYGYKFTSDTYPRADDVPPLIKLHGSFNWKVQRRSLTVSRTFEERGYPDDCSGWMPPSVFKRPPTAFRAIWIRAAQLVTNCDVLRVIGSSLRNEDFALLSLVFVSQLKSRLPFSIELIVPDKDALGEDASEGKDGQMTGIMQRLPFLGKLRNLSSLSVFAKESHIAENVFYSWVLMKVREIEGNTGRSMNDDFIGRELLLEV